jgi:hypothetical protein
MTVKLTDEQVNFLLENDPNFINTKRFGYSLKALAERYPDGAPDRIIASALSIPIVEVSATYDRVVQKMQELLKVEQQGKG